MAGVTGSQRSVVLGVGMLDLIAGCASQYGLAYLIPALRAEGLELEAATALGHRAGGRRHRGSFIERELASAGYEQDRLDVVVHPGPAIAHRRNGRARGYAV